MSVEENKRLARQFIDRFTANDIAGAFLVNGSGWEDKRDQGVPRHAAYLRDMVSTMR